MNLPDLRQYAAAFVVAAATIFAGWITYNSGNVPEWYIGIVSAVAGYLYASRENAALAAAKYTRRARGVTSWFAKPIAKWITLAALGALLSFAVPYINGLAGKTFDVGHGVTITIPQYATDWGAAQTSNLVQWLTDYVNTL